MLPSRGIIKVSIALFVVWHMFALGIYSLTSTEGYPALEWLNTKRSFVRPYVLMTSQWQHWNLFSPNPLRRVTEMDFKKYENGKWETVLILNEKNVSFFRRAPELKLMRRMDADYMKPLRERYVHDICRVQEIPAGTRMLIQKRWHVIPKHTKTESKKWWNNWEPNWQQKIDLETTCPPIS